MKCRSCFRDALPDRKECRIHLYVRNRDARRLRAERRAKGLCTMCGRPAFPGRSMCERDTRRYLKGGGPPDLSQAKRLQQWPPLTKENAPEWYARLVTETIRSETKWIPSEQHEDFAQDIQEKLLLARTFEQAVAKGFIAQTFRCFVNLCIHRHTLNWIRGHNRALAHAVMVHDGLLHEQHHMGDAEEILYARKFVKELEDAFPKVTRAMVRNEDTGGRGYALNEGLPVTERRSLLKFLVRHDVVVPPKLRRNEAALMVKEAITASVLPVRRVRRSA